MTNKVDKDAKPNETEALVQRLCSCTQMSKAAAKKFVGKADDKELGVLKKASNPELNVKLHELVTLRAVKEQEAKTKSTQTPIPTKEE